MIAARVPVVVFVGPSGARAASAGFIITLAADVAVMAPGTHIGAAHPVPAGGEGQTDETMAEKAAADASAYARTLADSRGRNATLAAAAVVESRAFTEREALEATPPLIDYVVADVDDLLRQLDGRTVRRFDGRTVTLETTGIRIERVEMTRRQTVPQRHRASADRLHAAHAGHARADGGAVEPGRDRCPASPAASRCCSRSSPSRSCP